ncbi:HD-GYP domain-containing protein [Caloramator sp. ALD01]|uniref:HD-GYP domain-containing protein n=1 Tax=Caloramator sp. ALD01 TaxID=1031288 RepID=UPI0004292B66|nr:HD domain-containing phosphohydrolase [Caloramator sp. ALD01]
MRLYILTEKLEGQILGNTIYNDNGVLFLREGSPLTANAIKKLKNMGINTVYIKSEDKEDDFSIQEVLESQIKLRLVKELNSIFNEVKTKKYVDYEKSYKIVKEIIENINMSENAILLNNLIHKDEISYLSIHSIDVAILSIIIGVNKRYDEKKIYNLGLAALLHDVGKVINSEKEHHAILGYNLLKSNVMFKATTYTSVYQHHEMNDGSGPLGLRGDNIFEFAKIINICDMYKNLIEKEKLMPHQAIEHISALTNKVDQDIYRDFIKNIYCYPNGLRILLNNGEEGVVIAQNKNIGTRPIVKVKKDGINHFYNLQSELTLFVEKVLL